MPFVAGQAASASANGTTVGVAFPSNNTAGNFLIASGEGDAVATSYTDTNNTPVAAVSATHTSASVNASIHYVANCAGGANTMTRTHSGANQSICIAEYSTVVTSSPLDQTRGDANTAFGTAVNSGNVTTTQANELLIGYTGYESSGTPAAATGSYTEATEATGARPGMLAHQEVTSTGAYNFTATLGGAANWVGLIATFKLVVAVADQEGYRGRNDDGSETTATFKAAQDTGFTSDLNTPFRVRTIVNTTDDFASASYQLEYRKSGETPWVKVEP